MSNKGERIAFVGVIGNQFLAKTRVTRCFPLMTPNYGLKTGRQRIAPFKTEKPGNFLKPIGVRGKVNARKNNRQQINGRPDRSGGSGIFRWSTVAVAHLL